MLQSAGDIKKLNSGNLNNIHLTLMSFYHHYIILNKLCAYRFRLVFNESGVFLFDVLSIIHIKSKCFCTSLCLYVCIFRLGEQLDIFL